MLKLFSDDEHSPNVEGNLRRLSCGLRQPSSNWNSIPFGFLNLNLSSTSSVPATQFFLSEQLGFSELSSDPQTPRNISISKSLDPQLALTDGDEYRPLAYEVLPRK
jgi:hypothetical protein